MTFTVLVTIGTRPEAIKVAPVIHALREQQWADTRILATAQHRQLLDQVLEFFAIVSDRDLNVMQPDQSLIALTSRLLAGIDDALMRDEPDFVLVQGDTTTVMATALAAYYRRIPVGHIEAGLRTGNKYSPFPEEINRSLVGRMADVHFAPTANARDRLYAEAVPRTA